MTGHCPKNGSCTAETNKKKQLYLDFGEGEATVVGSEKKMDAKNLSPEKYFYFSVRHAMFKV